MLIRIRYLLLGVGLLFSALCIKADDYQEIQVSYQDDLLSVMFDDVDLQQALEQIARATGIVFSVNPGVNDWVSDHFIDYALEAGMRRLLSGYNTVFLYEQKNGGRSLNKVVVLGRVKESRVPLETTAISAPADNQDADAAAQTPVEIVLQQRGFGGYIATGSINGKPVEFLIDTGATTIAISAELADKLGLRYGVAKSIDTANGRTTGFETTLARVELDELRLNHLRAIIMPNMGMGKRVLLGMNFLQAFELVQRDGLLIIRHGER